METKYLKINPADNVAVAITALPAGEKLTVDGKEITLNEDVPAGHKFALKDFAEGENVIKYGYPIGHARKAQKQGDWMNENNIKTNLSGLLEYTYNPVNVDLNTTTLNLNTSAPNLTFRGYKRKNGDVGVRNEIWIIPTVGCVNGIINQLAEGCAAKRAERAWMPSWLIPITTAAPSWATTTRIQRKSSATWCCIPMREPYSW